MINLTGKKVIVRGVNSGVFFGILADKNGQEVELKDCRNIWSWSGANNLNEVARDGIKNIEESLISVKVNSIILTDICEIIPCTEKSIKIIEGAPEWKF
jgi:hypothetical protein